MVVKMSQENDRGGRYSPGDIISIKKLSVYGNVDETSLGTTYVERANLFVRMHVRRMTRLTIAHSKKFENHESILAIYFCWYNWCRKHEPLTGDTPAMAQGLADKRWTISELLTASVA